MACCIETTGLGKEFDGFWAVSGLDLKVERGTFYGFLGPNGAGKSTTIKMLTGLLRPNTGSARIFDRDLIENSIEIKQRIGVVSEDLCLFESLTAREYLTFIGRMYRMPKKVIAERTEELLGLLNLDEQKKTLVLELSHGMKKKLALAAALIHDPDLLFLDEPFEGIDPIASRTIRTLLERFVERESTIFLTSHILEIVEKLCTHVGIIREGKLIVQSSLEDLSKGGSLESAFVEAIGQQQDTDVGLSWLTESPR